jgi:UDP-glucose 4-epimerase
VTLRYFNVFGPRQDPRSPYSGVISIFVDRLLRGQVPTVFGDGGQTRDFVYVADVVEANLLAGTRAGVSGRVFNVAGGGQTSLLELYGHLRALIGGPEAPNFAPARAGDIRHSLADIGAAREALGYAPRVPVAEGLARLVASVRAAD